MELALGILETHADADDEVRALSLAEEEAGRELRPRRDELDRAREGRRRRVDARADLGADLNAVELPLRDVHVDERMRDVGDGDRRGADRRQLAWLDVHVEDGARPFRTKEAAREALVLEGERGNRGLDARFCTRDLLGARAGLERREALLERLSLLRGAVQIGVGAIGLSLRQRAGLLERLRARGLLLQQLLGRAGGAHVGREGCDVLRPRACLEERQICARGVRVVGARVAGEARQGVVDLREQVPVLDDIAAVDRHRDDAPRDLEREEALVELDGALETLERRALRLARRRREPHRGDHEDVFYHTTDNSGTFRSDQSFSSAKGAQAHPRVGSRHVSSSSLPPPPEQPFRVAPSFHKVEDTGSFVPGDFEAQYEKLFSDALSSGPISVEERERLDFAASALGLDKKRLDRLESALLAAYEARAAISSADDTGPPEALVESSRRRPRQASIPELGGDEASIPPPRMPAAPVAADPNLDLHARFAAAELDEKFRLAGVLVRRGAARPDERALYDVHRPRAPLRPAQPMDARAWSELLRHPDQDVIVGEVFGVIASAVLLGRLTALRRDKLLERLDPTKKQDPATSTVSATRAIAWAAATLGMNAPPIYLTPERDDGMVIVPALPPALRVGGRMLRGQSAIQLAFHAGRALSWFRSEHFVCTLVPHLGHLEDLFLAALRIGAPELPMPPDVRKRIDLVKAAILPVLEVEHIASLRYHVSAFVERGGRTSLRGWARGAELTACRAGLVLSGDLVACVAVTGAEAGGEDRVRDLEEFWIGDACAALRAHLGVSL